MCGVLHIFIWNFAAITCPLVNLTRKGVPFKWSKLQQEEMQHLKDEIIKFPALCQLDYESGRKVILAIDTSIIVVGYILSQEGDNGKHI